ncbi:MAG: hypothetical protein AAFN81_03285 [Bacteroidota bacterium]
MNASLNNWASFSAIVVLILFLNNTVLIAQEATNSDWSFEIQIEENEYYLFDGMINERYPIEMYLQLGWNFCGENDNNRWNARQLDGWYLYKKVGKKIPLVGSIKYGNPDPFIRLYVPATLEDQPHEVTCDLDDYKEVFTATGYDFEDLFWQTRDMGEPYPVNLNLIHDLSWETATRIDFKWRGMELASFDLSTQSGVEYIQWADVLAAKKMGNDFYAIIEFGHLSIPGSTGSGYCGAGIETYLAFLKLNEQLEWETFEFHHTESCIEEIPEGTVTYDVNFPERGIKINK